MRRLNAFLKENAGLQALASRASDLTRLQSLWEQLVPEALKPYSRVGGVTQRRITVFADNGAVAAKLKMLSPTLLKNLKIKGVEVTSIRIEVQVQSTSKQPAKPRRHLSSAAAESLNTLADTLPDSPLREALERLAKKT